MIHTEGLHAIEQGLIPYMLEILFVSMPKSEQRTLDHLIKNLLTYPRQHGYKKFPRLLWHDGVSTLSYLTADLKVGKMFAICCIASTLEGEIFFKCFRRWCYHLAENVICVSADPLLLGMAETGHLLDIGRP